MGTSDSIKRNKMAENAPKTTPGLNETVQEFKAREDRDPEGLNSDVRINFEEIIAEPEGYHSSKYIWHLSNEVYRFFKDIMYQVFSLIFGVLYSLLSLAHTFGSTLLSNDLTRLKWVVSPN